MSKSLFYKIFEPIDLNLNFLVNLNLLKPCEMIIFKSYKVNQIY